MPTKKYPPRHIMSDIDALKAALADVRLEGLEIPPELEKRLFQAVEDNTSIDELIAEFDKYLDTPESHV